MRDEIKHTPGPWALSHDSREGMEWNIHIVQEAAPHLTVCFMTSDGPNESNARLIAAAPELLVGAQRAFNYLLNTQRELGIADDSDQEFETTKLLRAAIAKATGAA